MKVANCGHDENGNFRGGKAGDQTGTEWEIIPYFTPSYGWSYRFRWKDNELAKQFSKLAVDSAKNNHIGYCMSHRSTFEAKLKKAKWNPANITEDCEADCSSGVIALIHAIGYLNNIKELKNFGATYTGDMYKHLNSSSYFEHCETGKHYVGEINLTPNHHTNITVEVDGNGNTIDKPSQNNRVQYAKYFDKSIAGKYKVKTNGGRLRVRNGAGINYGVCDNLNNGDTFMCYGYYNVYAYTRWLYIQTNKGVTGFVSSEWVRKV